ncbi:MAG TPA: STAS domain-containing protein, partial [Solirubrobacteraceae bacterium]|nr:STAS domain-containing protein [Solirubrobacteraceae bacterium]
AGDTDDAEPGRRRSRETDAAVTADVAVEASRLGRARLVLLRGDINFSNAEAAERRVAELVAGAPAVVVDLSGVRYLDSSGLNLLLRQARAAAERRAGFVVIRDHDALPLFRLEAVGRALRVVGSREDAIAALAE